MDNNKELAYKYAWDWFKYHAAQRLVAFNYFLIIFSALGYGYIKALEKCRTEFIGGIIGIIGAVISVAFLCLESRNTMLVNDGRQALDKLENNVALFKKAGIRKLDKPTFGSFVVSHALWLRLILSGAFCLSLLGTLNAWGMLELYWITTIHISFILFLIFMLREHFWERKPK